MRHDTRRQFLISASIAALLSARLPVRAQGRPEGTPADLSGLGSRLVETYIRPSITQFSNAAAALNGAIAYFCRAPSQERFAVVAERFGIVVNAWFRILFLRFGPMVEDNRFERIFFWPDPRGTTLRQVQAVLAEQDMTAINADRLAGKSVALQGLPALEFCLFGSGAETLLDGSPEGRFRCAYALAISERVKATAGELRSGWWTESSFAREFVLPAPGNPFYRTDLEVAAELVKALSGGLAFLTDVVITPFLGKEPERANHKRAPFWRSGLTVAGLASSVEGIGQIYEASELAETLDSGDQWIDGGLRLELRNVQRTLADLDLPLEQAVVTGPGREALVYSTIGLKSINTTIETRLAPAIGVGVGFNALDGD